MRTFERSSRRMSAEEEIAVGRQIREAEDRACAAMRGQPCAQRILGGGRGQTRSVWLGRLEEAVAALAREAERAPELRTAAAEASAAWREAETLRWHLAMSQRRIALREARKRGERGAEGGDLAQEGHLGLLAAAERFDPERGLRFGTYARWWVQAYIRRAIEHQRLVRLPNGALGALRDLRREEIRAEARGERPSLAEVAEEAAVAPERAAVLLSSSRPILSLDAPPDDEDGGRPLAAGIADEGVPDALSETIRLQEAQRALQAVCGLPDERQRRIVADRFGLDGELPRSLVAIGRRLGLSRERVRQLQGEALRQLREQLSADSFELA